MAFQIKSFTSIVASLINRLRATTLVVTDFNVGSGVRTTLEANAQEIEELYRQMVHGIIEAIPTAIYLGFGFPPLPSVVASGNIRVTVTPASTDYTILAGCTFTPTVGTASFQAAINVDLPPGASYVDVPVAAVAAGSAGNVVAGTMFTLSTPPPAFVSAEALVAITNGADAETPDQTKLRFGQYITTLSRGTLASLIYGAQTAALTNAAGAITEQVKLAVPVEATISNLAPLYVYPLNLYVHNGVGGTSSALVALCQQIINGYTDPNTGLLVSGWKAAGVPCTVIAATEAPLAVTGVCYALPGYTSSVLAGLAQTAIATYLTGLTIGQTAIFAEMIALVMAIPGMSDFQVSTPTDNTTAASGFKIMPGALTITGG